jgi:hypothetical protein
MSRRQDLSAGSEPIRSSGKALVPDRPPLPEQHIPRATVNMAPAALPGGQQQQQEPPVGRGTEGRRLLRQSSSRKRKHSTAREEAEEGHLVDAAPAGACQPLSSAAHGKPS